MNLTFVSAKPLEMDGMSDEKHYIPITADVMIAFLLVWGFVKGC
jgi:hypothetical protein